MAVYEYQAKSVSGAMIKGKMEAVSEAIVAANLRDKNYYPIRIKKFNKAMEINLDDYIKVSTKDISIFCKQLSVIISAGISILRGLEIVKEQTENKRLKKILNELLLEVQKGEALSTAMGKYKDFPEMLINMVEVGESGGTLDTIMVRMSEYYEKENKLNQKIKAAMTYPMAICIFAVIVVILLVVKVLPAFIKTLTDIGSGEKLPLPTRIVIGFSDLLVHRGIFILAGLIVIVILFGRYAVSIKGRKQLDKIKISMPLIGKLNRKIITARFARTFGMLMGSGVPVIRCIEIASKIVGNVIFKEVLLSVKEDISKGVSMGDALELRNIFPPMLTQMVKIGEESGSLDLVLEKTAQFYDDEVDTATSQLTTIIEPLIIVVLAVVVGFIIVSIILPMFQMYNSLNAQNG